MGRSKRPRRAVNLEGAWARCVVGGEEQRLKSTSRWVRPGIKRRGKEARVDKRTMCKRATRRLMPRNIGLLIGK